MSDCKTGLYSLIQYSPDRIRRERINVGYWLSECGLEYGHTNVLPVFASKNAGMGSDLTRAADCLGGDPVEIAEHLHRLEKSIRRATTCSSIERFIDAVNHESRSIHPLFLMTEIREIEINIPDTTLDMYLYNDVCGFDYKYQEDILQ